MRTFHELVSRPGPGVGGPLDPPVTIGRPPESKERSKLPRRVPCFCPRNTHGRDGGLAARPTSRLARPLALALVLGAIAPAFGQVQVTTLGGGPLTLGGPANGFVDGDTLNVAQFNRPSGCAIGPDGRLYVADRDNHAVRVLDVAGNLTRTFLNQAKGLNRPVGVAVDPGGNVYVANNGDGTVRQFDQFGNPGPVVGNLGTLMAIALDSRTNLYVAELGGTVRRISPAGEVSVLAQGLNRPRGLALLNDGSIAVTVEHAVQRIDPVTRSVRLLAGSTTIAGFTNGPAALAKFNTPQHIVQAPNGTLVVADRFNHQVRLVTTNGFTTTLYGVSTNLWSPDFPGWEDGSPDFAASREPIGLAVSADGTVFVTESYWHIIRMVTGTGLQAGGAGGTPGGGTNGVTVPPPVLSPDSGYLPMGQEIIVSSSAPTVYYTLDGSEPTTNSLRLSLTNNVGVIRWQETLRDLTSLRVKAVVGTNSSVTVGGVPAGTNNIGIHRDLVAGIGATVVVPVVVNLRTNVTLKSVQFRVEIAPVSPGAPAVSDQFRTLSVRTNDFIPVVTSSEAGAASSFSSTPYSVGNTRGLAVSFIGERANFNLKNFGVVALVAVPVPPTAHVGDVYRLRVLEASGTSEDLETPLEFTPQPARDLVVANVPYLVGDSALVGWYNAGDFGNGDLKINDVNNAFEASLGLRVPYAFTDLFNAMDAFPPDTPTTAGGDGQIRFLDWQTLRFRSLRLDSENWTRAWSAGGVRVAASATLPTSQAQLPARVLSESPGTVWFRQALLGATSLGNVEPNTTVEVPVYVDLVPGASLAGLQFRAFVTPEGGAPPIAGAVSFVPEVEAPFQPVQGLPANEVGVAWNLDAFAPPLVGSNLLGWLRFRVPINANRGDCYAVSFAFADGSPDFATQYDFETRRACVAVRTAAPAVDPLTDEWRAHFAARGLTPEQLAADADPDGDGQDNLAEYLAGTDPTSAASRLQLLPPQAAAAANPAAVALRWLSAPGKRYVLEATADLLHPDWSVIAADVPGDGQVAEVRDLNPTHQARFYRLRLAP